MAATRGGVNPRASEMVFTKGGGITGGGSPSVTPFMLQNLTKSLSESTERNGERVGRRSRERVKQQLQEVVVEAAARQQHQVRIEAERERRDGVVVCKERSGGVQWKYVSSGDGRGGEKAMQAMHAKQHRDPVAVGLFTRLLPQWNLQHNYL